MQLRVHRLFVDGLVHGTVVRPAGPCWPNDPLPHCHAILCGLEFLTSEKSLWMTALKP